MVLLYASRACYNLAALALAPRSRLDAFDYDWYNVSDQVGIQHLGCLLSSHGSWPPVGLDSVWVPPAPGTVVDYTNPAFPQADLVNDLGNKGYLVFGLILFVWELLPTTLLVGFFRVHRPPQDLVRASGDGWTLGIPGPGSGRAVGSQWWGGRKHDGGFLPQSTSRILNGQVFGSRSYFFDRAGHCEDEGCSWEHGRSESTR